MHTNQALILKIFQFTQSEEVSLHALKQAVPWPPSWDGQRQHLVLQPQSWSQISGVEDGGGRGGWWYRVQQLFCITLKSKMK